MRATAATEPAGIGAVTADFCFGAMGQSNYFADTTC